MKVQRRQLLHRVFILFGLAGPNSEDALTRTFEAIFNGYPTIWIITGEELQFGVFDVILAVNGQSCIADGDYNTRPGLTISVDTSADFDSSIRFARLTVDC